ncbi:hypothetical protein AB4Y36_38060 [Paraburkholderia sp. BR10936]
MVYVQNSSKAPVIIPGIPRNIELAARRITPVDATVWAKFKASKFGKHYVDDETLTEASAEEYTEQPETPAQTAEREDAEAETENVASRRRPKKSPPPSSS